MECENGLTIVGMATSWEGIKKLLGCNITDDLFPRGVINGFLAYSKTESDTECALFVTSREINTFRGTKK